MMQTFRVPTRRKRDEWGSPLHPHSSAKSANEWGTRQAGDLIVVLEAMKMETNVTAPVAGKVKSIGVETGAGVKVNQILAAFE